MWTVERAPLHVLDEGAPGRIAEREHRTVGVLGVPEPDHIRGRIFGFDYMLITLSLSVSAVVASAVADRIGAPITVTILGGVALAWAGVWFVLSRGVRKTGLEGCAEPDPDTGSERVPSIS